MRINNANFDLNNIKSNDFFICAVGYESRSSYLLEKLIDKLQATHIWVFYFDDYNNYNEVEKKISELEQIEDIILLKANYSDYNFINEKVIDLICREQQTFDELTIHIDYSSMPRSWYCRLFNTVSRYQRDYDKIFFWYVEGNYPESYTEYPSAGIDSFSIFSGMPEFNIVKKRVHVLGIGLDIVRTQAIRTILDPELFIVCMAYDSKKKDLEETVSDLNEAFLMQSCMNLKLHLDDFSFMVVKLCEIVNELLVDHDVILIPDGPKPLVLAFSIIPDILKKEGVTCLHISRNKKLFSPIDVTAKDKVVGFEIISR